MQRAAPLAFLASMLALALPCFADSVTLTASRDTTLYSESAERSNGSGSQLFAGMTASGGIRRALLAFDVAGAIPAGSRIVSVSLTLVMTRTIAGSTDLGLHPVLADWGEAGSDAPGEEGGGAPALPGDATWRYRFLGATPWSAPGGDFAVEPRAVVTVTEPGSYRWGPTAELAADVQRWLDGKSPNFGWILIAEAGGEADVSAKRFASRENRDDPSSAPTLTIEYTPQ